MTSTSNPGDTADAERLEQLYNVFREDVKLPLPPFETLPCDNRTLSRIHEGFRSLVIEFPDFVESFIEETADHFRVKSENGSVSTEMMLRQLSASLSEFMRRVGQPRSPSSSDVVSFFDSSDDEASLDHGDRPEFQEEDPIVLTDDDLESHSSDSPSPQPRRLFFTPVGFIPVEDKMHIQEIPDDESEEDPFEVLATRGRARYINGARSKPRAATDDTSSSSYTTASTFSTPQKRKHFSELDISDLEADSPSRRRLEAIRRELNGSSPTKINNGQAQSVPVTPLARPANHTGATGFLNKLNLSTRTPDTDTTLTPLASRIASSLKAPSRQPSKAELSRWDPSYPVVAPSRDEEFVELLPRNSYQGVLNNRGVSYYVQWELERHVYDNDEIEWCDFQFSDFDKLVGKAADILPRIPSIVRSIIERKRRLPPSGVLRGDIHNTPSPLTCAELDLEEASIRSEDGQCGGRVAFAISVWPKNVASTTSAASNPTNWPFTFRLCPVDPPSKSTRLAPMFGSRRVLHLRFSRVDRVKLFAMFRGRALVLFGKVFRVLFVQPDSDSAVAIETNDQPPGYPPLLKPLMPSFLELLGWFNDLWAKPNQAMAKWASRFQLVLSDSVPALYVEPNAIGVIGDIVCASAKDPSRPETVEILTDGCGLMSEELARRILQQPVFAHLDSRPCSVQMRIGGAKGLLSLMSPRQQDLYPGKHVILRDSMIKSEARDKHKLHPALSTLDVLRVDYMKVGATLSSEPIIVLEHNGVPTEVLLRMAQNGLEEIKRVFLPTPHEGETPEDVAERLISATYRLGGVATERRRRDVVAKGHSAKVAGVISGMFSASSEEEAAKEADLPLAERLYEILLAGYIPTVNKCAYAASLLRSLVRTLSDKAVRDFKISVDQSATAFIVPDSTGVLAPDEIFVSFSSDQPVDPVTRRRMMFLEGECLLFRYPCKLPTDVRKCKAVVKPELFHLRDCIVLSANSELCTASPASFLGGGDYDGDTATVIWDPALVTPFQNAPSELAVPPPNFQSNFVKRVTSVREVLDAVGSDCDDATLVTNLQHFLLGAMLDEQLAGIYSSLHDTSVYIRGCGHPQTMRLAHMFCSVLDARKSGLSVPHDIRMSDRMKNVGEVAWRRHKKGKDDSLENITYAQRPLQLGGFIMDILFNAVEAKQIEILALFPDPSREAISEDYSGFTESFKYLVARPTMADLPDVDTKFGIQVNMLDRHVKYCLRLWTFIHTKIDDTPIAELYKTLWTGGDFPSCRAVNRSERRGKKSEDHAQRKIAARMQELTLVWRDGLQLEQVPLLAPFGREDMLAELKVACAIQATTKKRATVKVPFELDLATMCAMKARMDGPTRCVPAAMATRLKPTFSHLMN